MAKYFFYEGTGGDGVLNYHCIDNDLVNEYFFSSSRKGWCQYGLIIRIINDTHEDIFSNASKYAKIHEDTNLKILRNDFNGNDFTPFREQIAFLRIGIRPGDDSDLIDNSYIAKELIFVVKTQGFQRKIGTLISLKVTNLLEKEFYFIKYFSSQYFALFSFLEGVLFVKSEVKLCLFDVFRYELPEERDNLLSHAMFGKNFLDLTAFAKGGSIDFVLRQAPRLKIRKIYRHNVVDLYEIVASLRVQSNDLDCTKRIKERVGIIVNSKKSFDRWIYIPIHKDSQSEDLMSEVTGYIQSLAPETTIGNSVSTYFEYIKS